jgi:hypothetical protein
MFVFMYTGADASADADVCRWTAAQCGMPISAVEAAPTPTPAPQRTAFNMIDNVFFKHLLIINDPIRVYVIVSITEAPGSRSQQ